MSSLVKCKACGNEIAKGVKKCVHCGKDQRGFIARHKILTLLMAGILILIFALGTDENLPMTVDDSMPLNEYKDLCEHISYDHIAREPDKYSGKKVQFVGEIIQAQEVGSSIILRVNVTETDFGLFEDTIWVNYTYQENQKRLLEEDIVYIWGEIQGLKTYESVLGASITIPEINARSIEVKHN